MPARLDPFVEVMLRERADQLYLLPDEPVTLVKDGKPRKVSKQPLTDQHIYAMVVEVAPPEAADKIDHNSETEFEYAAGKGLVRVRIVPEAGRLTAVISAIRRDSQEHAEPVAAKTPALTPAPPRNTDKQPALAPAAPKPEPRPRASVIAAAPMVESPAEAAAAPSEPSSLPSEFAASQYKAAEQRLGKLLRTLVESKSSDLHLRVGEPAMLRTHGEIRRQPGETPLSVNDLELLFLSIMQERNRGEWKETGDTDFA
jgi:Tfp pilus assembly pilus retraction ATPase PilT